MGTTLKSERGSVLIVAVIAMLIMGVLAVSFALLSNIETAIGFNYKLQAQAESGAEAGLQRALDEVRNEDTDFTTQIGTGTFSFNGTQAGPATIFARIDNDCTPALSTSANPALQDANCATTPGIDSNQTAVITAWATAAAGGVNCATPSDRCGRARVRAVVVIDSPWNHVCSSTTSAGLCNDPDNTNGNPNVVPSDPNDPNGPKTFPTLPLPTLGCSRIDPLLHRGPILAANQTAGCAANALMYKSPYPTAPTAQPRMVVMGPDPNLDATQPSCNNDPGGTAPKYFGYFDCALSTPCDPRPVAVGGFNDTCPDGRTLGCVMASDSRVTTTSVNYDPQHYVAGGPGACGGPPPAACTTCTGTETTTGMVRIIPNGGLNSPGSLTLNDAGTLTRPFVIYAFNNGAPNDFSTSPSGFQTAGNMKVYGTVVIEGQSSDFNKTNWCTGGPGDSSTNCGGTVAPAAPTPGCTTSSTCAPALAWKVVGGSTVPACQAVVNPNACTYGYPLATLSYEPTLTAPTNGCPQDCATTVYTTDHGTPNTTIDGVIFSGGRVEFNPIEMNGTVLAFDIQLQATSSNYVYKNTYANNSPPPGFPLGGGALAVSYNKSFAVCSTYSDESGGPTECK